MASLLPLIQFQQSTTTPETERSSLSSLQSHFPKAPTLPGGSESIVDADYRKAALKLLLSDEAASIPITGRGNDYASSYWIDSTYKRNFGGHPDVPAYADVSLVAAEGDGKPESPYFPNRASAPDADPANLPVVTAQPDPEVPNDLSSVAVAGSEGNVKSRDPKTYSSRMDVVDSAFDSSSGQLSLTKGNSRITMQGSGPKFGA